MRMSQHKTRKPKSIKHKTRKPKSRNPKSRKPKSRKNRSRRNIRGGAGAGGAAAVRPIESYIQTPDLREIMDKTRAILVYKQKIDIMDPHNIQAKIRLEKQTILYVARKIASVLRDRGLDLNTPIINYLKNEYAKIINEHQMHLYRSAEHLENEFNLENGNNSNEGNSNLYEIFGNEYGPDETDDEIMEMVNEFNQQS